MQDRLLRYLRNLKGTPLHPQWLSDRYHATHRKKLHSIGSGYLLDIGSGDSDYASLLGSGPKLVRLDYPDTNVMYEKRPDIYANAKQLPIGDGIIENILILEVIEHIDNYRLVLGECRRVLSPKGRLFISAPFIYPAHDIPHDFHRFTLHGMIMELKLAGFDVDEIKQHGNSIVVALQMLNLAFLELAKKALGKNLALGITFAPAAYALCMINNILALPFLPLKFNNAAVFGHFIVAKVRDAT